MVVEPDRPQRIARLTPLADVLARLEALIEPVTPRATDPFAARGRTLAEDVVIPAPMPATARALSGCFSGAWASRTAWVRRASGLSATRTGARAGGLPGGGVAAHVGLAAKEPIGVVWEEKKVK